MWNVASSLKTNFSGKLSSSFSPSRSAQEDARSSKSLFSELEATADGIVSSANVSAELAIQFSAGYKVLDLPGRWISEGSL
jgi:hypothetical protein